MIPEGDRRRCPFCKGIHPTITCPTQRKLVDLRNYDMEHSEHVLFTEEKQPLRINHVAPHQPEYQHAQFEIRTVLRSDIPGINQGDKVLFTRCLPALDIKPIA